MVCQRLTSETVDNGKLKIVIIVSYYQWATNRPAINWKAKALRIRALNSKAQFPYKTKKQNLQIQNHFRIQAHTGSESKWIANGRLAGVSRFQAANRSESKSSATGNKQTDRALFDGSNDSLQSRRMKWKVLPLKSESIQWSNTMPVTIGCFRCLYNARVWYREGNRL